MFGVAAAFCLSAQAVAGPAAVQATTHHVVRSAASRPDSSPAQLTSATLRATEQKPDPGLPAQYTVQPGDSLSAIAGHLYGNPAAWPVLYWANHSQIPWADDISPGQVLHVPAAPAQMPSAPALLGPPAPQAPAAASTSADASPASTPVQAADASPASTPEQATASADGTYSDGTYSDGTYSDGTPGGSFGQCVIARESGGNAQVMNSSGHYGLYQFSASTWAAYGGNPADFGDASVAEQNQVFANALAQGGESNWSAYDGC
jgi:LysM repeat protein